jgi:hypothetical protein
MAAAGPSRVWYLVAVLVWLLASAVGALVASWAISELPREVRRVGVPGASGLPLEHSGSYTVFYERPSLADLFDWSQDDLGAVAAQAASGGQLHIALESPSAHPLEVRSPVMPLNYSYREDYPPFLDRHGEAVARFQAPEPGVYIIDVAYADGSDGPPAALAIVRDRRLFFAVAGAAGPPVVGVLAAVVITVLTFVKRRNRRSRGQGSVV